MSRKIKYIIISDYFLFLDNISDYFLKNKNQLEP